MGRWLVAFSPSHFFCPGQGAGPLFRGQLVPLGTRRQHPSPSGGLFSGRCYLNVTDVGAKRRSQIGRSALGCLSERLREGPTF